MVVSLQNLKLEAFRSFDKPAEVRFPKSGLVLFSGPSGSGKSSILLALSHALGYCPYPATELHSWHSEQPMRVRLELSVDGQPMFVTRGQKAGVRIGEEEVKGATHVQSAIEKGLGIRTDLLAALTYRPQQTRGLFLSKTNAEMQEFLSVLLQLDHFEEASEVTKASTQKYEDALKIAISAHDIAKSRVDEVMAMELGKTVEVDALLDVLKREEVERDKFGEALQHINDELDELTKQRSAELDALQGKADFKTLEQTRLACSKRLVVAKAAWDTKRNEIREKLLKLNHSVFPDLQSQIREVEECEKKIVALEQAKCPTCYQKWANEELLTSLKQKIARKDSILAEYSERQAEAHRLTLIEEPTIISDLREMESSIAFQRKELEGALEKGVYKKYDALFTAKEAEAQVASELYLAVVNRVAKADTAVQMAQQNNKLVESNNARLEKMRMDAIWKKEQANDTVAGIQKKLNEENDFYTLLKSFMGSIFDEVLAEIAWNANELLKDIPNVAHVTVGFKSEVVTQKGTTKKSIVPTLSIGGAERPIRSALSGGMLASVELAVDIAVRKVISARAGVVPNWLVLDECFEGLGTREKESAMFILSKAAKDTLILVVDHASEFKEMFNQVIEVQSTNGHSTLSPTKEN